MSRKDILKNLYIYGGYALKDTRLYPECGFSYGKNIYEAKEIVIAHYITLFYDKDRLKIKVAKIDTIISDEEILRLFDDIYVEGGYLINGDNIFPYCDLRWDNVPSLKPIENTIFYSLAKHERMQPILYNAMIGKYTVTGDY